MSLLMSNERNGISVIDYADPANNSWVVANGSVSSPIGFSKWNLFTDEPPVHRAR
jgi:hypothetical protein